MRQPDGSYSKRDARTQPFIRFENNEAHCQRLFGFSLGGFDLERGDTVDGVGPDSQHLFLIRKLKIWTRIGHTHSQAPSVLLDGLTLEESDYEILEYHLPLQCAPRRENGTGRLPGNTCREAEFAVPAEGGGLSETA